MEPTAGSLLIASPALLDPNFASAVILLLDADADGALGVVINRPSQVLVGDVLEPWAEVATTPEVMFIGGPVALDSALAVARLRDAEDQPVGWRPAFDDVGMVDLDSPVELVDGSLREMRLYAGYAGWGAGQLEDEIAEGSWYVVPGAPGDLFREHTDDLRRELLRRQPGSLAWVSTRPADPLMN
ncbi:MAG: YqgE/AlgH family protein [Nocardioides sp.]|nr:YqgE/AlgH family protein [Nocardioides sp.]